MKKNINGFSAVEIAIIVVIVGLLGGISWFVYSRNSDDATRNSETQAQTSKNNIDQEPVSDEVDTSIYEVDIDMQTAADISKLPEYTPESFKKYMLDILQENEFYHNEVDDVDTITQYQISKISQFNIIGGRVPVDKNGETRAGGAPAIWVLTPTGKWDEESLNGAVCKSENGGLIYEEFVEECFTDPNTDSWVKNPNGSITTLID